MKHIGWKVFGRESDMRVAEFRTETPDNELMTYEQAKVSALQRLREHVAPYLARIEELEQDVFGETGALPPFRAWRKWSGVRAVVIAKTKRRATELARETRYGFDNSWHECEGDWWYHLAHQESIWIEEQDDKNQGTGVYYKPLSREEAEQILEPYISPYRTMGIEELLAQVGQTSTITGVSAAGTPYKITTEVEQLDEDRISVKAEIDDCLGWGWHPSASVDRKLSKLAVVGTEEWAKEGF
jgi:hypothetical protein